MENRDIRDLEKRLAEYNARRFFKVQREGGQVAEYCELDLRPGEAPERCRLGVGTFGAVYRIRRVETRRDGESEVYSGALKVIALDSGRGGAAALRAKTNNEIAIQKKLSGDSNIVCFETSETIEFNEEGRSGCDVLIRMELLDPLRSALSNAARGERPSRERLLEVLALWEDVASALQLCERVHVLHKDVKPANVFHSAVSGKYKLSDFGEAELCEAPGRLGQSDRPGGTLTYIAPEVFAHFKKTRAWAERTQDAWLCGRGQQPFDIRADMYSLGVMIYEKLAGGRPFEGLPVPERFSELPESLGKSGGDRGECAVRLLERRVVPGISGVPADVNAVLLKSLSAAPEQRQATCGALKDEVTALRLKYAHASPRGVWTGRWLPVALGATVVGVLGIGGVLVAHSLQAAPAAAPAATAWVDAALEPDAAATEAPDGLRALSDAEMEDANAPAEAEPADGEPAEIQPTGGDTLPVEAEAAENQPTGGDTLPVETEAAENQPTGGDTLPVEIEAAENQPTGEDALPVEIEAAEQPTAAPTLALETEEERVLANDGAVELHGLLRVEGEIDPSRLETFINGSAARAQWTAADGGYTYAVAAELDLSGADAVFLEVRDAEDPSIHAEAELPVEQPAPVLTLRVEDESLPSGAGLIELRGEVEVQGEASPDELELLLEGQPVADVEWTPIDGGYAFALTKDMNLTEGDEVSVAVRLKGRTDAAVSQVRWSVRPAENAEAADASLASIEVENREALETQWLGAESRLTISGTADPAGTLRVSFGETVVSPAVEADGRFTADVFASALAEGENRVELAYLEGGEPVVLTVRVDTAAPQLTAEPAAVDQFAQSLRAQVSGETQPCEVILTIAGAEIARATTDEQGAAEFSLAEMGISEERPPVLTAVDCAGNIAVCEVPFARSVRQLEIENLAEVDGALFGGEYSPVLRIHADPDAQLRLTVNGSVVSEGVQGGEGVELSIPPETLAQGDNTAAVEYSAVGGYAPADAMRVEFALRYDGIAPELSAPEWIYEGAQTLSISVSNEPDGWQAWLSMDGENWTQSDGETFALPDGEAAPRAGQTLFLAAVDAAGNRSTREIGVRALTPIQLTDADAVKPAVGEADAVVLEWSAEEGGVVDVFVNGEIVYGGDGRAVDVTTYLVEGTNEIALGYDGSNGYPGADAAGLSLSIVRDTVAPEIALVPEDGALTRDTQTLAIQAVDATACTAAIVHNGAEIPCEATAENQFVWSSLTETALAENDELWVRVTDAAGNVAQRGLTYQNVSELAEARLLSGGGDYGAVRPGEALAVNLLLACNGDDLANGCVECRMEGADGNGKWCTFVSEPAELTDTAGLDVRYVNAACRISSIEVPADCPTGDYTLLLMVDAEHGRLSFNAGSVHVESAEGAAAGVSAPYVSPDGGVMVGLDPLPQETFPASSVVVTGWVWHAGDENVAFDHYTVESDDGWSLQGYFAENEWLRTTRYGTQALAGQAEPGLEYDAGFMLNMNLSQERRVQMGGNFTVRFFDGEDQELVSASFAVDGGAPEVSSEWMDARRAEWAVAPEAEATQTP